MYLFVRMAGFLCLAFEHLLVAFRFQLCAFIQPPLQRQVTSL